MLLHFFVWQALVHWIAQHKANLFMPETVKDP